MQALHQPQAHDNKDQIRCFAPQKAQMPQIPQIAQITQPDKLWWSTLAEFELLIVDFQGFDSSRKSRSWDSKLSRRSRRSGNPAPTLSERRLEFSPARFAPQHSKPAAFNAEMPAEKSYWKAITRQLKKHQWNSG